MNNKGDRVILEYKDGSIKVSKINDMSVKFYTPVHDFKGQKRGVRILLTSEFGGPVNWTHVYDENLKIKRRIIDKPNEPIKAIDYAAGGKKVAESILLGGGELQQADIYDDSGKVIKKLKQEYGKLIITDILPDGSNKTTKCYADLGGMYEPANSYKVFDNAAKEINYTDIDGNITKTLNYSNQANDDVLEIETKDGINCRIAIPRKDDFGALDFPRFDMFDSADNGVFAAINKEGNNSAYSKFSKEQLKELEKTVLLALEEAKKENFAVFPYKKAEEYLAKIFNHAA